MAINAPPASAARRSEPIPREFSSYLAPALADVNVPAYVLDVNGRICWLNNAARALAGDVIGHQFTEVVDLDDREARRIFNRRLARLDEGDHTVALKTPRGERRRVDVSSVPLGPGHHVVGMFGIAIPSGPRPTTPQESPLTRRQQQILELMASGESTTAMASDLFLSEQTVRNHVRQVLQRLGTKSRLAAVAEARRHGYV